MTYDPYVAAFDPGSGVPVVDDVPVDPCPFAVRVGRLPAWQHGAHAVSCGSCGRHGLRFAWFTVEGGHECGRCYRRRVDGEESWC